MLRSINPYNKKSIAEFKPQSREEVGVLIRNSHEAFLEWSILPLSQRKNQMIKFADYLERSKLQLAKQITDEMGKPITQSVAEIDKSILTLRYYIKHADRFLTNETVQTEAQDSYIRKEPLGVILAIMPWNYPIWQVVRFLAPALLAGNTVILKHASNVTQTSVSIENAIESCGFPDGTLHSLIIPGAEVEYAIRHPLISAVTFTGSNSVGASVAKVAGEVTKKCVLELGGSDPFIVLSDADVKVAAETAVNSRFLNCGQSCIAAKRFFVHSKIYEQFIDEFLSILAQKTIGDPMDEKTDIGPLATESILESLHAQVTESISMGARAITGSVPLDLGGYFYAPTVLVDVNERMPVMLEETFGPVAAIKKISNDSEALDLANKSEYGLGASVWTEDKDRAEFFIKGLTCGNVFINSLVKSDPRLPFGGVKNSGYGRELGGVWGVNEFVNIKSVWIDGISKS